MVHELDLSVGKIVKSLGDNNMLENTVIVFSTDNGGPAAGFNQNAASNWPLKGVACFPFYRSRLFALTGYLFFVLRLKILPGKEVCELLA